MDKETYNGIVDLISSGAVYASPDLGISELVVGALGFSKSKLVIIDSFANDDFGIHAWDFTDVLYDEYGPAALVSASIDKHPYPIYVYTIKKSGLSLGNMRRFEEWMGYVKTAEGLGLLDRLKSIAKSRLQENVEWY